MSSEFELYLLEPSKRLDQTILRYWLERKEIPQDKKQFLIDNDILSSEEAEFFDIRDISDPKITDFGNAMKKLQNKIFIDVGGFAGANKAIMNVYFSLPDDSNIRENEECKKKIQEFIVHPSDKAPWFLTLSISGEQFFAAGASKDSLSVVPSS